MRYYGLESRTHISKTQNKTTRLTVATIGKCWVKGHVCEYPLPGIRSQYRPWGYRTNKFIFVGPSLEHLTINDMIYPKSGFECHQWVACLSFLEDNNLQKNVKLSNEVHLSKGDSPLYGLRHHRSSLLRNKTSLFYFFLINFGSISV